MIVFAQSTIPALLSVICLLASNSGAEPSAQNGPKLRMRAGDRVVTATLNGSEAARDFAAMLPLQIQMRDHMRREKTGPIPRQLSERTQGSATYALGDLGYWRPDGNFVIFYRHDGLTIPSPGIVRLGSVDSDVGLFDAPGNVDVTIELLN